MHVIGSDTEDDIGKQVPEVLAVPHQVSYVNYEVLRSLVVCIRLHKMGA